VGTFALWKGVRVTHCNYVPSLTHRYTIAVVSVRSVRSLSVLLRTAGSLYSLHMRSMYHSILNTSRPPIYIVDHDPRNFDANLQYKILSEPTRLNGLSPSRLVYRLAFRVV
jgi:hypothetical protein